MSKKRIFRLSLPLLILFFGIFSFLSILKSPVYEIHKQDNHLLLLAEQFTKGNLSLSIYNLPRGDYVDYFAKQYLYFGPFPSILLMPFVAVLGREFPQIVIGISSILISFLAVYRLSHKLGSSEEDSLWLSIFFVFSTVLFSTAIINITALQVQVIGMTIILLSIAEHLNKRRYLIVGTLIGLAGMTRMTLYLYFFFFAIQAFREKNKIKKLTLLILPVIVSLLLLGAYNYRRFHSFFETGYKYNITSKLGPLSVNLKEGMFSFSHLPANLFTLLIKAPEPIIKSGGGFVLKFPYMKVNPWGLAIWFTSPLFIYLVKTKKKSYTIPAVITTIIIIIPSLLYFGIGYSQFGYRYSLDFLPLLLLLLIPALQPRMSIGMKTLIIIGVLFNCIYLGSLWGIFPHFYIFPK